VVTLSGIVISLKLVHSSNAKSPMVVVLLGITTDVIPDGTFPELLKLGPNIEYVREVLKCTVDYTAKRENYVPVQNLEPSAGFFKHQCTVNENTECVPSHNVIEKYINHHGHDYRFEVAPNPIIELRDRKCDNVTVGRTWNCRISKDNDNKE